MVTRAGTHSSPSRGAPAHLHFHDLTLISSLGLVHRGRLQVAKWNHYFFQKFSNSEMRLKHMETENFQKILKYEL